MLDEESIVVPAAAHTLRREASSPSSLSSVADVVVMPTKSTACIPTGGYNVLIDDALAGVSGTVAAAVRLSSSSARANAMVPPHIAALDEVLCILIAVQQPASINVYSNRQMEIPWDLGDDRFWGEFGIYSQATVGYYPHPVGSLPDDVLLRLSMGGDLNNDAGGGERTPYTELPLPANETVTLITPLGGIEKTDSKNQRIASSTGWTVIATNDPLLAPAEAIWFTPPRFTVYSGAVPRSALARLATAHGGGGGANVKPLRATLVARIEHPAFTWASGAKRTLHGCSGGDENGGCPDFDDIEAPKAADAVYAPAVVPAAPFTFSFNEDGDGDGGATKTKKMTPTPCAGKGYWSRHASPGAIALPSGDGWPGTPPSLWWHDDACPLREFTNGQASECIAAAASPLAMVGDSHIRRHFKDMLGRGADVLAWYGYANVVSFGGEDARQVEHVRLTNAAMLEAASKSSISPWCLGRFQDIDCQCSDVAYGPTDKEPNPLEFIFKFRTSATLPSGAFVMHSWFTGFLLPEWRQVFTESIATLPHAPHTVVFDLGHWDVAFSTLRRFERDLPDFVTELASAFPHPAQLIFRTPTFFAGTDNTKSDRFKGRKFTSGGKLAWIRDITLRELRANVDVARRLRVWDVWHMGEGRALNASISQLDKCSNGHEGAADIHVENQVLLNMLCPGAL